MNIGQLQELVDSTVDERIDTQVYYDPTRDSTFCNVRYIQNNNQKCGLRFVIKEDDIGTDIAYNAKLAELAIKKYLINKKISSVNKPSEHLLYLQDVCNACLPDVQAIDISEGAIYPVIEFKKAIPELPSVLKIEVLK